MPVALNTLDAVREEVETRQGEEMLMCGTEEIEVFLNLRMLLSCFSESSDMVIAFPKVKASRKTVARYLAGTTRNLLTVSNFTLTQLGRGEKELLSTRNFTKDTNSAYIVSKEKTSRIPCVRMEGFFPFWRMTIGNSVVTWNPS